MKDYRITAAASIPGAVIDPETGRLCALKIDIARGLSITPSAVAICKPRIYQTRYADINDVLEARATIAGRGRPRGSGYNDANKEGSDK